MAGGDSTKKVPVYGWGLALVGGLLWVLFGLVILVLPGDPGNHIFFTGDPSTYPTQAAKDLVYAALVAGVFMVVGGVLQIVIAFTAFRRGERWSWYAVASTVVIMLGFAVYAALGADRGSPAMVLLEYLTFALFQILALLVTLPRFFFAKAGRAEA